MKKKIISLFLASIILAQTGAFAFSFRKKKEQEPEREPMVHTVDEWEEAATSVKMDMRKRDVDVFQEKDDKFIPPKRRPLYIEAYNLTAGSKELDLTELYKEEIVRSYFVSDPNFENAVYTETYYHPQTRQTSSTFYLIELDKHLSKKERLDDVSVFEHTRYPLITTSLPYLKEGFFSTLTLVDFSETGNEILVKEKRGSNKYGIYETRVWLYFITDEDKEENECYLNNIDFSNEMAEFAKNEGFLEDKKTTPSSSAANQSLNKKAESEFKGGFSDLEGLNIEKYKPDYDTTSWGEFPTLNSKDIKSFIKTTWKNDAISTSIKTRWHNVPPEDYMTPIAEITHKKKGFGVKLNLLNEMIKAYWFDRQNLILNHIRWDIKPLGFSTSNKDEIIVKAFAYNKSGEEVSLGNWAVNVKDGLPRLMSPNENLSVGANGFYLVEKLNTK